MFRASGEMARSIEAPLKGSTRARSMSVASFRTTYNPRFHLSRRHLHVSHATGMEGMLDEMSASTAAAGDADADEVSKAEEMYTAAARLRYPLAAVVGQDAIKTALLLGAVDKEMGGVAIGGRRGTGKTVLARGLQNIMPPIEVVSSSYANADPANPREWETDLTNTAKRDSSGSVKTHVRSAPFVQIPLGVTEDRLVGTVDIEESMRSGTPSFQPGLLAEAHRGILYVDDINLLDEGVCNLLLSVLANGENVVEREGLSIRHPCRPLLVATFNPDEGELRDHLLDRIAISLSADQELTFDERIDAVESATRFQDDAEAVLTETSETTEELRTKVLLAREWLQTVSITDKQIEYLIKECIRGRVQGHRAESYAVRAAKALAALDARDEVNADDLKRAAQLVIVPRADPNLMQEPSEEDEQDEQQQQQNEEDQQQEQQQQQTQQQQQQQEDQQEQQAEDSSESEQEQSEQEDTQQQDTESEQQNQNDDEEQEESSEDDGENEEGEENSPQIPEEFMFEGEDVEMEEDVMQFSNQQNANTGMSGRSKSLIFSDERGRYVKAIMPQREVPKRVAVDATLRSAAPFQKIRREQAEDKDKRVYVEKSDFKQKKLARKAGALVIFVVDASGSMALNRMNSAKGAALRLLNESYMNRDQVCIVPFRGEAADVLLPPSRSIAIAKSRLDTMPCGGGSPLAHGLETATLQGLNAMKRGDVGRVMVVMLSDGRGNISLARSKGEDAPATNGESEENSSAEEDGEGGTATKSKQMTKDDINQEVLATAKKLGSFGFSFLAIDTEAKWIGTGFAREIAKAANGRYYYLPNANDATVASATSEALNELRGQ